MTLTFTPRGLAEHDIKIIREVVKRIRDKIKGEIETAEKSKIHILTFATAGSQKGQHELDKFCNICNGKVQFGEDLEQWIKNNIKEA